MKTNLVNKFVCMYFLSIVCGISSSALAIVGATNTDTVHILVPLCGALCLVVGSIAALVEGILTHIKEFNSREHFQQLEKKEESDSNADLKW